MENSTGNFSPDCPDLLRDDDLFSWLLLGNSHSSNNNSAKEAPSEDLSFLSELQLTLPEDISTFLSLENNSSTTNDQSEPIGGPSSLSHSDLPIPDLIPTDLAHPPTSNNGGSSFAPSSTAMVKESLHVVQPSVQQQQQHKKKSKMKMEAVNEMEEKQGEEQPLSHGKSNTNRKQDRVMKNRDAARESRRKQSMKVEEMENRLKELEATKLKLQMKLKIGREAMKEEKRENEIIRAKLLELLNNKEQTDDKKNEEEISNWVEMYKNHHADYGVKRRDVVRYHLNRVKSLLMPTQVTKMCLYGVEQGDEKFINNESGKKTSQKKRKLDTVEEDSTNIWVILAKEMKVTDAQQMQIFQRRERIKSMRNFLYNAIDIVNQLETAVEKKNLALEEHINSLQNAVTPRQAAKFILWVKENPAFMYMLDKLVDSTLQKRSK